MDLSRCCALESHKLCAYDIWHALLHHCMHSTHPRSYTSNGAKISKARQEQDSLCLLVDHLAMIDSPAQAEIRLGSCSSCVCVKWHKSQSQKLKIGTESGHIRPGFYSKTTAENPANWAPKIIPRSFKIKRNYNCWLFFWGGWVAHRLPSVFHQIPGHGRPWVVALAGGTLERGTGDLGTAARAGPRADAKHVAQKAGNSVLIIPRSMVP